MARPARQLTHIRQLCGLGIDPRLVTPALATALHDWVDSDYNVFTRLSKGGHFEELYTEAPDSLKAFQHYAEHYAGAPEEGEFFTPVVDLLRRGKAVASEAVDRPAILRTRFYTECLRPAGIHAMLRAVVQDERGGGGMFTLVRTRHRPFTDGETKRMEAVLPYLAQFLCGQEDSREWVCQGEPGMLVSDRNGHLRHACPRGRQLLALATGGKSGMLSAQTHRDLVDQLPRIGTLALEPEGPRPVRASGAHQWRHDTPWGRFFFKTHWLDNAGADGSLLGITVRHQTPRVVALAAALHTLPLAPREQDVCLLVAQGLENAQIAQRLNLSPQTTIGYLRSAYDKLGLRGREELVKHLLHRI